MRGVLSIYIFKRYQSSEILIKDKDHQCQGRESNNTPALLCRPSPTTFKPLTKIPLKRSQNTFCAPPCLGESKQHPNFPSVIPQGIDYFVTWKNIKPLWESELPANCHSAAITNERMKRRIFFHNSWTINMHMFKILLPELLLKIDAFYL